MQATASQSKWATLTYVWIALFAVTALILGLIQLVKRMRYQPDDLQDHILSFAKEASISDEQVIIDFADSYFTRHLLGFDEIIRFLITSLTILGLLGTFVGLADLIVPNFSKLSNTLNTSANVSNFPEVLSLITEGFKNAFFTSIWGIIAALFTSILYHIYRQKVRMLRSDFIRIFIPGIVKKAKQGSTPYDPQEFYKQVQDYFVQGMKQFQDTNLASHEKLLIWAKTVVESHTKLVNEYVESTNKRVQSVTEEFRNQYKNLKSISKDNLRVADILDRVVAKLDAFSDVISNYDKTYAELLGKIEEFSQNFGNLFSSMNDIVQTVSQPSQLITNLYNSIQEMVNSQGHIISSNNEFLKEARSAFDLVISKADENSQTQMESLKASLDGFVASMNEAFSPTSMDAMISPHIKVITEGMIDLRANMEKIDGNTNSMNHNEEKLIRLMDALALSVKELSSVMTTMEGVNGRIDKINRNLGNVFSSLAEA